MSTSDSGFYLIDWAALQGRYFCSIPVALDKEIAQGTCLSERHVKRLRFCEQPVQLHQGFRIAAITHNARLVEAYAREAQPLTGARPLQQEERGNMDVYLEMKKKIGRLDELEYRLLKEGMLLRDEQAEFDTLCEDIARYALALRTTARPD